MPTHTTAARWMPRVTPTHIHSYTCVCTKGWLIQKSHQLNAVKPWWTAGQQGSGEIEDSAKR